MKSPANDSSNRNVESEITLFDLFAIIWQGKYTIMAVTGLATVIAIAYALVATEWYRAEALLAPAEDKSMSDIAGQLSGLAAIAGVRTSSGNGTKSESIAVLRSRAFARDFINDFELLPVFLDAPSDSSEEYDIRDAVRFFHDNVLRVSENRDTGLVTVSVEWTDPETAAAWANALVERLNSRMRDRAQAMADANIQYLKSELASNNLTTLEQSIGRIMESEMQKLMLARGNEEYSFRVIDAANPPRLRSRPRRTFLVISTFVVSGFLSLLIVFARSAIRQTA